MATSTKKDLLKTARGFVELIARSNFSFLQGASHPEEMVEQAIRFNYDGISLCDLNGLYGVARAYQAANNPSLFSASMKAKEGFHFLIGSEVHLTNQSKLVLTPINRSGYAQLCQILTLGKRQAEKGFCRLSLQDILNLGDDLLVYYLPPFLDEVFLQLQEQFKDRLYLPIWRDLTWESQRHCQKAFQLEQSHQAQLFVTQRPLMHTPERKPLFDVLTCILHHCTLEEANDRLIQNAENHLRPLSDLSHLWQDRLDLLEVTLQISQRVHFDLSQIRYRYPRANLPESLTPAQYLRRLSEAGAQWRYPQGIPQKIKEMMAFELDLITELEYEDYFLTLYEICQFAKEKDILFQGRGSAANSVVCFCLGLTSVDPTKIDLLFERFISRERGEPPDIDIDFEHSRREEVIQHIYEKYDEKHAAMVCTVIRFRSRMSLRETAKVFGIPLKTINELIRFAGRDGLRRLIEDPQICHRFLIAPHTWKLFLNLAQQLHGFPRHLGIHTGGFMITQDPLNEIVPVEKATMNGRYVIQWNKDDVAILKLMKIDVLSLGMLTALRRCFDLLRQHKGLNYNLATLPAEDSATYDMICKADTVGVFQIESRAQMNTLPRLLPRNFYDLVIEIALVRPGPLQGGMVHPFLRRRQGLEKPSYAHPDLAPILQKTMGVPIFQEQVMKIAIVAAGFTPGEADELRRIMSSAWRKRSTMASVKHRIMTGLNRHGINMQYAEQIYRTIEGFANYGFPESHAASFAVLTYASCYIKQHHPEVFACALLNSQPMGFYPPRVLIADAQRHGVEVAPIDINISQFDYSLEANPQQPFLRLRVGLRSIYAIPEKLLRKIEEERRNGPYLDLSDFIRRLSLPRSVLVKLAAAGAFASFIQNPRQLIWHLESVQLDQQSFLVGHAKETFAQEKLHSEGDTQEDDLPFESQWDGLRREYDHMGFSVNQHPLGILRNYLEAKSEDYRKNKYLPYVDSKFTQQAQHKVKVRVAGLVGITQRPPTAKGMCFITLEDEFGFMNIVIPPDVYQKDRLTIYSRSLLEIQGYIEKSGPIINIKAQRVLPLS